ncbi:hypothetical protein BGZ93_002503 [Podila epicladia]|nr:hypothetical protein BGZ93_002503 [Podila epicladia]
MPEIESYCEAWLQKHLAGYMGIVNLDTIGGQVIESHLHLTRQWPDLYGKEWVDADVRLCARKSAYLTIATVKKGSVCLAVYATWSEAGIYTRPRGAVPRVLSVQITFHANRDTTEYSVPPGGFRLAVVNATSLETGYRARDILSKALSLDKDNDQLAIEHTSSPNTP